MTSWRDQLAFAPLESGERGEEIGRRLRHAIELGVLEDGTQLPSEADLAAQMRVSTLTLRTALAELRREGLLETRRGRGGGSFVRANSDTVARAQLEALAVHALEDLRDLREYRAFLAGAAAAAAAERSQQLSIRRLSAMGAAIGKARHPTHKTRTDSRFHIELAAASRSVRLTRQEMAVQAEVASLLWITNDDHASSAAAAQHAAIVDAIRLADARLARILAEEHAREDMNRLIDLRMSMDSTRVTAMPMDARRIVSSVNELTDEFATAAFGAIGVIEEAVIAQLAENPQTTLDDMDGVYETAQQTLSTASPTLWGLGFIADSSHFADPGLVWCYAPAAPDSLERLVVDPEFYDYLSAPWWPDPAENGSVHTTGAYVDASGTNEYIITFSKRVVVDGHMVGVAAADVLVSQLQSRFQPLLTSFKTAASIVDQNDVVVATSTGSLLGGTLTRAKRKGKGNGITLPAVPWRLHIDSES